MDRLVHVVYDQGLQIQALQRARADDVAQLRDSCVPLRPNGRTIPGDSPLARTLTERAPLRRRLRVEVAAVRSDLRAELGDVEQRLDADVRSVRDVAAAPRRNASPQTPRSARAAEGGGSAARTARAAAQRAEEAVRCAEAVREEMHDAMASLQPAEAGSDAGALVELHEQVSSAALQADQALAVAEVRFCVRRGLRPLTPGPFPAAGPQEAEDKSKAAVAEALSDVRRSIADSADEVRAEARMAASHAASLESRLVGVEGGVAAASEACERRATEMEQRLEESVVRAERGVAEAREETAREAAALQDRVAAVEERALGAVAERVEQATRTGDAQWEALRGRVDAVEAAAKSAKDDAGRAAERGAEAVEAASELESAQSGLLGRMQILEHDMAAARGETAALQRGAAVEDRATAAVDRVERKLSELLRRVDAAETALDGAAGRREVKEGVARLDASRRDLQRKLEEEAVRPAAMLSCPARARSSHFLCRRRATAGAAWRKLAQALSVSSRPRRRHGGAAWRAGFRRGGSPRQRTRRAAARRWRAGCRRLRTACGTGCSLWSARFASCPCATRPAQRSWAAAWTRWTPRWRPRTPPSRWLSARRRMRAARWRARRP